jgi:excisionase family DNA binding protein
VDNANSGKPLRKIQNLQTHPDPYVTIADLAAYWSVSRKQLYKQVEAGTLKALRLGPRSMRISTADARAFEQAAKMDHRTVTQSSPEQWQTRAARARR